MRLRQKIPKQATTKINLWADSVKQPMKPVKAKKSKKYRRPLADYLGTENLDNNPQPESPISKTLRLVEEADDASFGASPEFGIPDENESTEVSGVMEENKPLHRTGHLCFRTSYDL